MFLVVYVPQVAIRQDQEAGYLKKQHPLQHKTTCRGRTVTPRLRTRPVYLQEVTIITPSRTLSHPMHPPFHSPLPIQRQLQQLLQLQQQQLQQQQLLQPQLQLPFRISNKWVSAILKCNFLLVNVLFEAIDSLMCDDYMSIWLQYLKCNYKTMAKWYKCNQKVV